MSNEDEDLKLVGTGTDFTTQHLSFDARDSGSKTESSPIRIIYQEGEAPATTAWRLRLHAKGQEPLKLPGSDAYFRASQVCGRNDANRLIVVLGNWMSSLSSLHNWMVRDMGPALSLDLDWVFRSGQGVESRLLKLAHRMSGQVLGARTRDQPSADPPGLDLDDPVDFLEWIAEQNRQSGGCDGRIAGAVLFRDFDALDTETSRAFFGRLRRLCDDPRRPLVNLPIVLLGHSYLALDPRMREPGSNLLPFSEVYSLDCWTAEEAKTVVQLGGFTLSQAVSKILMHWSGGHPLLVQVLLGRLRSHNPRRRRISEGELLEEIEDLEQERLPAFETWVSSLLKLMEKEPEIVPVLGVLLREREMPRRLARSRFGIEELYIQGWIDVVPKDARVKEQCLVWRSDLRRKLAAEAFAQRSRS